MDNHGLKYNTIAVHINALSACLPLVEGAPLGTRTLVTRWLRGYKAINPPRQLTVPPWDLAIVLAALRENPFEPLEKASLKYLTFKAIFLLAVTSVRRVSELQALTSGPPFCTINPRSILLRVNASFCPKTATEIALKGVIELHSFPRKVRTDNDRELRKNCPVRALTLYIERTKSVRKDPQLFVAYGDNAKGRAVSKQTMSRWVSQTIRETYEIMGRDPPARRNPHTTRGVASSWAEMARAGLVAICQAATWSQSLTFAKFYRLDFSGSSLTAPILQLAHSQ